MSYAAIGTLPVQSALFRNRSWNKPKAARRIAAEVVDMIRSADFDIVYTVPEIDEWIAEWGVQQGVDLAGVSFASIRAAMKQQSGVRFELRRLLSDQTFQFLRRRNKARKHSVPARAWIFTFDREPELVVQDAQLYERIAA